jgi:molybdopterin converting factor small subunit
MIQIRVLYLGSLRQRMEKESEHLAIEDRATIFMLRRRLFHKLPKAVAARLFEELDFTINLSKVALNTVLKNGDEVAVIPKDMVQKSAAAQEK